MFGSFVELLPKAIPRRAHIPEGIALIPRPTTEMAVLWVDDKRLVYPYDVMKDSDIYRETGHNVLGTVIYHYFEYTGE